MRLLYRWRLFFLCWLMVESLTAQDSQFRVPTIFGPAEGLMESPTDMVQDDEGFLWLATYNGLFRFDGVHASKIHLPVTDSLARRCDNIYDLCFDQKNQLIWLGTDGGLFNYNLRTGSVRHFHPKNYYSEKDRELQATHVVFADRQGDVWAEFGRYGFAQLSAQGELLRAYYLPLTDKEKAKGFEEKLANTVLDISQDPNHENVLWMNTREGLLQFDKAEKRLKRHLFYSENERLVASANSMTSHFAHPNGFVYIGTWNAGLLKFDPTAGHFTQLLRQGGIWKEGTGNAYRITSVVPDRQGHLWTNGTGGAAIFNVENEQFIPLTDEEISVDFQDRDGNYWDTHEGLKMYHHLKNQGEWVAYSKELPCKQMVGLLFDRRNREVFFRAKCDDGAFWAMNVDDHSYRRYPLADRKGGDVSASEQAENRTGFYLTDGLNLELYLRAAGNIGMDKIQVKFPSNVGYMNVACSHTGELFVTGFTGWLFWLKPPNPSNGRNDWEMISFTKSALGGTLPDNFHAASAPTFDTKGNLWILNSRGFCIFSPETNSFRHFQIKPSSVAHLEAYNAFVPDGQKMWVSGKGGIGWFDIDRPEAGLMKSFRPAGIYSNETFVFEAIIEGELWLKTSEGWAAFDPNRETFHYFDNIKARQLVQLGGGNILADEGEGFRLLHLDSLQASKEIPKPYVSWFKVFERPLAMPINLQAAPALQLKPDENFFSIGFSALATYNTAGIRFAYQLEGVNPEWVFPEPNIHAASFTNIEGGDYTFKIKTTNSRGEWLDNVYELKIHVGTPWYKTWWFRLAALALVGGMVYFFVKNRFRQQQILLENQRLQFEKEVSLRNERDRIAAEMHDDLGAGLSTIRFLSFAAKEKEADPENAARIDKISAHASQVMEKMADIIWVMNSRNDTVENLISYLRRYAGELLETHGIRLIFDFPMEVSDLKLSGEQRRSLLLAVKECLHNVVKHSRATEAKLSLKTNGQLEIVVQDNGKGISEECLNALADGKSSGLGNGLHNIRQRMEALGGTAIFENGSGSTVILQCPIATI